MEELIYKLVGGAAHLISGAAAGKATRKLLKSEYRGYKETAAIVYDALLGLSPDSDIFLSFWGGHRNYSHIPYVEFLYGAAFGFFRDLILTRKLNVRNNLKNSISSAVATTTHFLIDLLSGGYVPINPNVYIGLYDTDPQFNAVFHLLASGLPIAGLLYVRHRVKGGLKCVL